MPSDYASIRDQNIKEYGEGTRHLAFLGNLYSDRTHFILELLQNAEDARASWVKFRLFDDRLELLHNGRPFDMKDVVGICGVDASTKSTDLTTIGRFGVGFKSVYAYTMSPRIYSGDESFVIEHFVRPRHVLTRGDVEPNQTLQVFPFDHPDVKAPAACQQIAAALQRLSPRTLLFLRHVGSVSIDYDGRTRDLSRRVVTSNPTTVETLDVTDGVATSQRWWLFERAHSHAGKKGMPVQIAFQLQQAPGGEHYEPIRLPTSPLVVFFPTEKETNLGFLLQGPFRTTPARDNIPADDEWNMSLVHTAAKLVVDALVALKKQDLLTMRALGVVATRSEAFPAGSMFRDVHSLIANALSTKRLIPTTRGSFARGCDVRIPVARVQSLLTDRQLTAALGAPGPLHWLGDASDVDEHELLDTFLASSVGVPRVALETVVARLDAEFLEAQSDRWIATLYSHLHDSPTLWRASYSWQHRGNRVGIVGSKPIIRLEDGTHVAPFDDGGEPTVYLPTKNSSTAFVTVRRRVAGNVAACAFLRDLGLHEPDAAEEVIQFLLPRYEAAAPSLTDSTIEEDWNTIARAVNGATDQRRKDLIAKLGPAPIVRCTDSTGTHRFQSPQQCYWRDESLEEYFAPDPGSVFVDEIYDRWKQLLNTLGVASRVRITSRRPNRDGHIELPKDYRLHRRGRDGFDPDLHIDGLTFALQQPTITRSEYVWNTLLVPRAKKLSGTLETATRKDYTNSTRNEVDASILEPLRTSAWLPTRTGRFVRPHELSIADLPDGFNPSDALAEALGMQASTLHQASTDLGIPADALQFLRDNPGIAADLAAKHSQALATAEKAGEPATEEVHTFSTAAEESFNRPGSTTVDEFSRSGLRMDSHGSVSNPSFRRDRVRENVIQIRDSSSGQPRLTVSVQPQRDPRDEAARQFLLEQYGGHCQICDHTFPRRNGEPYFEGVHLAERKVGRHTDRPGGMLCLCARCGSMFQHGAVSGLDIDRQIDSWRAKSEGGSGECVLRFTLCGEPVVARFTEKHFLDLQVLLRSDIEDLAD